MSATRVRPTEGPSSPSTEIPEKLYFKIGEVAQLVGVEAHVLRYWEKEISSIRPGKSASNQRRYRRRDVELFREIRRLLYEEKYTLAGARRRLVSGDRGKFTGSAAPIGTALEVSLPLNDHDPFAGDPDLVQSPELAPCLGEPPAAPPPTDLDRLERLRAGLRELIRFAGGEVQVDSSRGS